MDHCPAAKAVPLCNEVRPAKLYSIIISRGIPFIYRSTVRYDYTHAIPVGDESEFKGQPILRDRRVSIICRTIPNDNYSNA